MIDLDAAELLAGGERGEEEAAMCLLGWCPGPVRLLPTPPTFVLLGVCGGKSQWGE